ncbi:CDP-diacylglycerol--glycerol-3-phosphate 3-phosphatidyltransferase [Variovorax sp. PBL-H6]|uniref:CDP-alcohol phosphatidyltransferase family protein n=1 Tax=Variovorax sp. PBL-H6 TaxID=434009 RepID=UPI001316AB9C|nr:CDP-alcohol phosphatidyltransferase family protein [Variovorax sp. PBL-H6]VTU34859.1 CDP-diacylglycerol--glycerol-3-phosphate 3-phosphatidyltransferase [Variovorax sp. PBL-H6]
MLTRSPHAPASGAARLAALRRDAWREALPCFLLLAALAALLGRLGELGPWFQLKSLAVFAVAFALVLAGLAAHAPNMRFGAANRVTLARLALIAVLAALIGEPAHDAMAWGSIAVAASAALLDALDGPLARRGCLSSNFGARFDMETDALLVLVLSMLVVHFGKAGPWILTAGLMRHVFVLAARPWPWLARTLPSSRRRKTVCVVQITSLIACLGPIIALPWSRALAAASLTLLAASFAIDIAWLLRHRDIPPETAT